MQIKVGDVQKRASALFAEAVAQGNVGPLTALTAVITATVEQVNQQLMQPIVAHVGDATIGDKK